jgi:hypothetical protein
VAEAKLTGRYNHIGASKDYQGAVWYASFITGSSEETDRLIEKTKNILSLYHWDAVELLAGELIKHREIGYKATREN